MDNSALIEKISQLRKERNALILAHNYVAAEIQAIADFCGDSLELSIKAAAAKADMLIVCGVRFMAETAKILSPDTTVVMVRSDAGCPMADMVDPEELKAYKAANPDTLLIAYVNKHSVKDTYLGILVRGKLKSRLSHKRKKTDRL